MLKKISFLLLFFSFFSLSANNLRPSDLEKPTVVKVLIAKKTQGNIVEVKGRYHVYDIATKQLIASGTAGNRYFLTPLEKGLRWGEHFHGVFQVRLVPTETASTIFVDGIQYRGCLEAYNIDGDLFLVNEVSAEDYLKSVMNLAFAHEEDHEVLDALAIACRTNLYYQIVKNKWTHWHVNAEENHYRGYAVTMQNPLVDKAVDLTKNVILTYHGNPFATTWTEDSAGHTATFASIFRKKVDGPEGVESIFSAFEKEKRGWSFEVSKEVLAQMASFSGITSVDLYQDEASHKVYAVRINNGALSEDIDFFALQKSLGKDKLKSNDFQIKVEGEKITFSGFGVGHGVGFCLYSAKEMANRGWTSQKILQTFYPETELKRFPSLQ